MVGDEHSALCSFPKLSSRYVKPEKCIVVENKEVWGKDEVPRRALLQPHVLVLLS